MPPTWSSDCAAPPHAAVAATTMSRSKGMEATYAEARPIRAMLQKPFSNPVTATRATRSRTTAAVVLGLALAAALWHTLTGERHYYFDEPTPAGVLHRVLVQKPGGFVRETGVLRLPDGKQLGAWEIETTWRPVALLVGDSYYLALQRFLYQGLPDTQPGCKVLLAYEPETRTWSPIGPERQVPVGAAVSYLASSDTWNRGRRSVWASWWPVDFALPRTADGRLVYGKYDNDYRLALSDLSASRCTGMASGSLRRTR